MLAMRMRRLWDAGAWAGRRHAPCCNVCRLHDMLLYVHTLALRAPDCPAPCPTPTPCVCCCCNAMQYKRRDPNLRLWEEGGSRIKVRCCCCCSEAAL